MDHDVAYVKVLDRQHEAGTQAVGMLRALLVIGLPAHLSPMAQDIVDRWEAAMREREAEAAFVKCPDCPDGSRWDAYGPDGNACATCDGHNFVLREKVAS